MNARLVSLWLMGNLKKVCKAMIENHCSKRVFFDKKSRLFDDHHEGKKGGLHK